MLLLSYYSLLLFSYSWNKLEDIKAADQSIRERRINLNSQALLQSRSS